MITTLGFTTRDRPEYLRRCVESFVANCRAFERRPRLLVVDDAEPGRHASARDAAERLARDHPDFAVWYLGAPEKRAFAERLAAAGLPAEVLEFALFDPEGCGYSLGANRNALQLATAGEHVLYVDDDCLAETARPPRWDDRLAVVGLGTTQEYWFYPDYAAALAAARFEPADVLELHERYLGRQCAAIMAEQSDLDAPANGWIDLMRGSGSVKVTQNGVVGDSCMYSNIGHLLHGSPASRARLARSQEALATAMSSREIIRSPARPTLRLGGLLIGPDYACDGSTLLPPYFPVFRSSDTSFSNLLMLAYPAYAFADIPWLVTHRSVPGRGYSARGFTARWRCSAGEAVRALFFVETPTAFRSVANPLLAVGDRLTGLGRLPPGEFADLVRGLVDELIDRKAARLEELLARSAPAPPHYARAVEGSVRHLRASLLDPLRFVPVELHRDCSPAEALARLQRLVGRFGEVLRSWQSVDGAARALADGGLAPAVKL